MFTKKYCEGYTAKGTKCKIHSEMGSSWGTEFDQKMYNISNPLREGKNYCEYHKYYDGVQCEGITKKGKRCNIFSSTSNPDLKEISEPLRNGKKYCVYHQKIN